VPPSSPRQTAKTRKGNSRILRAEATGVILIAVLILIITVVRYWRNIPWGAR
jgi:succinate dehydrogenase hydrophobic anchor subunit